MRVPEDGEGKGEDEKDGACDALPKEELNEPNRYLLTQPHRRTLREQPGHHSMATA